jgi:hypothetical protein
VRRRVAVPLAAIRRLRHHLPRRRVHEHGRDRHFALRPSVEGERQSAPHARLVDALLARALAGRKSDDSRTTPRRALPTRATVFATRAIGDGRAIERAKSHRTRAERRAKHRARAS